MKNHEKERSQTTEAALEKSGTPINTLLLTVGLAVIVVWILGWLFVMNVSSNPSERGAYGDMFGMVNSLFSAFAFAGIIITVYLQKIELGLQRKELEETRAVFEKQSGTMALQRFEITFFNLIELHRKLLSDTEYSWTSFGGGGSHHNRFVSHAAFDQLLISLERHLKRQQQDNPDGNWSESVADVYSENNMNVEPVFNNLRNILSLIERLDVNDNTESYHQNYAEILTAQLYEEEKKCLFYYLLYVIEDPEYCQMCRSYCILDGVWVEDLTLPKGFTGLGNYISSYDQ